MHRTPRTLDTGSRKSISPGNAVRRGRRNARSHSSPRRPSSAEIRETVFEQTARTSPRRNGLPDRQRPARRQTPRRTTVAVLAWKQALAARSRRTNRQAPRLLSARDRRLPAARRPSALVERHRTPATNCRTESSSRTTAGKTPAAARPGRSARTSEVFQTSGRRPSQRRPSRCTSWLRSQDV